MSDKEMEYEVLLHDFVNIINNFKKARDYYKGKNKDIVVFDRTKFAGDIEKLIQFNNHIFDLLAEYKERVTILSAQATLLSIDNTSMFNELMEMEGNPVAKMTALNNHLQTAIKVLRHGKKITQ